MSCSISDQNSTYPEPDIREAMSYDPIDYQQLMQAALRDVVRRTLEIVVEEGLPDGHFFYITFVTTAPGVAVSAALQAQYPDEMTIILQHQFWDLEVNAEDFSVGLSFSGVPCMVHVPYSAVVSFVDPPSEFGLRFAAPPGFEDEPPLGPRGVPHEKQADEMPFPQPQAVPEDDEPEKKPTGAKVVSFEDFRRR